MNKFFKWLYRNIPKQQETIVPDIVKLKELNDVLLNKIAENTKKYADEISAKVYMYEQILYKQFNEKIETARFDEYIKLEVPYGDSYFKNADAWHKAMDSVAKELSKNKNINVISVDYIMATINLYIRSNPNP